MRLYIDTSTGKFITSENFASVVKKVEFKRGDAAKIDVSFVSGGSLVLLGGTNLITLGIKADGRYDGNYLVTTDSFTEDAPSFIYSGVPDFNTIELNDLINSSDGDVDNDVAYLDTMLEITWSIDNGVTWESSNTITARIHNDVNKLNEGDPTPATPSHLEDFDNPHNVTATQVGLGNVDNTSDADKPVSTATQTALDLKAESVHTHTIPDVEGLLDGNLALGDANTATGTSGSFSVGVANTVAGDFGAAAIGRGNTASGDTGVTAIGHTNNASGDNGSTAIGRENTASGTEGSIAIGRTNMATGNSGSTAIGLSNTASGNFGSTAIGRANVADGEFGAIAIGQANTASGASGCAAIGFGVTNTTTGVQEVGSRLAGLRQGAARIHTNGQVAQTLNVSTTPLLPSAAAVGSEANGELGVDMGALRLDAAAGKLKFDYNQGGSIITHDLTTPDGVYQDDTEFAGKLLSTGNDGSDPDEVITYGQFADQSISNSLARIGQLYNGWNRFQQETELGGIVENGLGYMHSATHGNWSRQQLITNLTSATNISGGNIACVRDISIAGVLTAYIEPVGNEGVVRFVIGDGGTGAPIVAKTDALTGRGWGFEVYSVAGIRKIKLFAHDGTTYTESAGVDQFSGNEGRPFVLKKIGATLSLEMGSNRNTLANVEILTLNTAPTTSYTTGRYVSVYSTWDGVTPLNGLSFDISRNLLIEVK